MLLLIVMFAKLISKSYLISFQSSCSISYYVFWRFIEVSWRTLIDLWLFSSLLIYIFIFFKSSNNFKTFHFCICVKRLTSCNCLCSSSSSCHSARLIWNIGEFGAKSYFTHHWTANSIHDFRDSIPVLKIHSCY